MQFYFFLFITNSLYVGCASSIWGCELNKHTRAQQAYPSSTSIPELNKHTRAQQAYPSSAIKLGG